MTFNPPLLSRRDIFEAARFVNRFQSVFGLEATGVADLTTWEKLEALRRMAAGDSLERDASCQSEGGQSDVAAGLAYQTVHSIIVQGFENDEDAARVVDAQVGQIEAQVGQIEAAIRRATGDLKRRPQPVVRFKRLPHAGDNPLPAYETSGAAAMDLRAGLLGLGRSDLVHPGPARVIGTGFEVAIPVGYEGQVRPRSGLAAKHGITVLNTPGTIDSDYRGEIKVILLNHSDHPFHIEHGDRIAQLVIAPVTRASVEEVTELDQTERGAAGFGSTGVK